MQFRLDLKNPQNSEWLHLRPLVEQEHTIGLWQKKGASWCSDQQKSVKTKDSHLNERTGDGERIGYTDIYVFSSWWLL